MQLRSRNRRATTIGIVGAGVSTVWRIYSGVTTAKEVPTDLQRFSGMLADPGAWPWLFMVGFVLLLGWSLWPSDDEPNDESATLVQTTRGPSSPAFGTVHGNVTINPDAPSRPAGFVLSEEWKLKVELKIREIGFEGSVPIVVTGQGASAATANALTVYLQSRGFPNVRRSNGMTVIRSNPPSANEGDPIVVSELVMRGNKQIVIVVDIANG